MEGIGTLARLVESGTQWVQRLRVMYSDSALISTFTRFLSWGCQKDDTYYIGRPPPQGSIEAAGFEDEWITLVYIAGKTKK